MLCDFRHNSQTLETPPRAYKRLHRAPEAKWLQKSSHNRFCFERQNNRVPNPHPSNAPGGGVWSCRPLGVRRSRQGIRTNKGRRTKVIVNKTTPGVAREILDRKSVV